MAVRLTYSVDLRHGRRITDAVTTLADMITNRRKRNSFFEIRKSRPMIDDPHDAPRLADVLIKIRTELAALEKKERWPLPVWKVEPSG